MEVLGIAVALSNEFGKSGFFSGLLIRKGLPFTIYWDRNGICRNFFLLSLCFISQNTLEYKVKRFVTRDFVCVGNLCFRPMKPLQLII